MADYNNDLLVKEQLSLFGLPINVNDLNVKKTRQLWLSKNGNGDGNSDYGTFKDSLRAPIHRWFKYPAGYSYRLVEEKLKEYHLSENDWVLDPFVGSGTTSIECKRHGVNSMGIEAHPFVGWLAQRKLNWNINLEQVSNEYTQIIRTARKTFSNKNIEDVPELVQKCYSTSNLQNLISIRDAINEFVTAQEIKDFFTIALIDTLRNASKAATGWPYIGPTKIHEKKIEKDAFSEFGIQVRKMVDDVEFMTSHFNNNNVINNIIIGDSRNNQPEISRESIDLAITSPPYLNNFDYADRTRLETYFLGWYNTWGEITNNVRDKLITSATTQIRRSEFKENFGLDIELKNADSKLYYELLEKVQLLTELRQKKGGKKSYDFLVSGYFNDMLKIIKQVFRYLKKGSDFLLVLGDSAPYGIYIPTDQYLARFALGIGFSKMKIVQLRNRGDKWKGNPQRHNVKLKEVILTLTK